MVLKTDKDPPPRTAYRVETARLVLRCWSPEDAPVLRAALDVCDAHLRPMIPFMKDEPRTLQQTAQWLRGHRAAFDLGQMYRYAVYDAEEQHQESLSNRIRKKLGVLAAFSAEGDGKLTVMRYIIPDQAGMAEYWEGD